MGPSLSFTTHAYDQTPWQVFCLAEQTNVLLEALVNITTEAVQ